MLPTLLFLRLCFPNPLIDTGGYDYAPSAMRDGTAVRVWHTCQYLDPTGGSHDAICESGAVVLVPSPHAFSWDAKHAAGPSVVKHDWPALVAVARAVTGVPTLTAVYLLYYECMPLAWADTTATCLALSDDGRRWWRWWDADGDGYGEWRTDRATPIVSPAVATGYGVGHPSAVRLPTGQVRLFLYDDSRPSLTPTGLTHYRWMDTSDGIHPWGAAGAIGIPHAWPGPGLEVKYDAGRDRYIALSALGTENVYAVGTLAQWSPFQSLGMARADTQPAWAHPTLVSDPSGLVDLGAVTTVISAESPTRGDWWQGAALYRYQGRFQ